MSLRLAMNSLAFIQITSLIRVPRASCRRAVSCREDEKDESYHTSNIFGRGTGGTDGLWWSVSQETVGMCILTSVGLRVRPGFFFLRS